jgi:hypothetical protein
VVEAFGEVTQRGRTARAHVVDHRGDLGRRVLDVELGAGQDVDELTSGQGPAAQVDPGDHEGRV